MRSYIVHLPCAVLTVRATSHAHAIERAVQFASSNTRRRSNVQPQPSGDQHRVDRPVLEQPMKRTALALALVAGLLTATAGCDPNVTHAATAPVGAWAFCGVHPDAAAAQATANALAWSGVTATMGPCMPPDWSTYTPSNPGGRYIDVQAYARLVEINATAGMQTVVYDARVWSDDPAVRAAAIDMWQPMVADIAAFDMGDEFDPATTEWAILVHRWEVVTQTVTPVLGVAPFTNHLAREPILDQAVADLPGSLLSFDDYSTTADGLPARTLDLARLYDDVAPDLMCAVNALPFNGQEPTWNQTARNMWFMRSAGCDSFLIFGGVQPYGATLDSTDPAFGPSLVNGWWPSPLAFGVKVGVR